MKNGKSKDFFQILHHTPFSLFGTLGLNKLSDEELQRIIPLLMPVLQPKNKLTGIKIAKIIYENQKLKIGLLFYNYRDYTNYVHQFEVDEKYITLNVENKHKIGGELEFQFTWQNS